MVYEMHIICLQFICNKSHFRKRSELLTPVFVNTEYGTYIQLFNCFRPPVCIAHKK